MNHHNLRLPDTTEILEYVILSLLWGIFIATAIQVATT